MKDYYQILEVAEDASEKEIKKAYRTLASKWHPDKHQGKDTLEEADAKFKSISEAYSTLSDPTRRKEYDYTRAGGPFGRGVFHTTGDPFSFFSGGGPFGYRPKVRKEPPGFSGETVSRITTVPLKDALFGREHSVTYSARSACPSCDAKGALEFTSCTQCKGQGYVHPKSDHMFVIATCSVCMGYGKIPKEKCDRCDGNKLVVDQRKVTVQIPPGLPNGAKLRLRGVGGTGTKGMPPGDLILDMRVEYPDLNKLSEEEKEALASLLSKE